MSFTSPGYIPLLATLFLLLNILGGRAQWCVLLCASLGFYASFEAPHLLIVLGLVTGLTFSIGILMSKIPGGWSRTAIFWGGVGSNIAILAAVKYFPFVGRHVGEFFGGVTRVDMALVSIGVSYFIFQAISYLADVYLGVEEPERHFGYFSLYMSFFPKLLQGPIERSGELLPQLRVPYRFDYENLRAGLLLFAWGVFKKVVIADRLGSFVDNVYGHVQSHTGTTLLFATYVYAIQLYCDFSGYTDMALGSSRILGIRLTQNFDTPYLATSIPDFWRRWHISFSRWILNYIFTPLHMLLRSWKNLGAAIALLVSFLISGIWHGTGVGFLVWGLLHGTYLAVHVYYKPLQKKIHRRLGLEKGLLLKVWQVFITFHLVCLGWIFFRATSIADSFYVITHIFADLGQKPAQTSLRYTALAFASLCLITAVEKIKVKEELVQRFFSAAAPLRWATYYALLLAIIGLGSFGRSQFLYFRF